MRRTRSHFYAGGPGLFSPAALFAGGVQGAWYDPSDLSTLFKDTAGTQPVTADGDSVALVRDKSGNGNHLTQATAGSRPLYKTAGGLRWLQFDGTASSLGGTLPLAQLGANLSKTAIVGIRPADFTVSRPAFHYGLEGVTGKSFGIVESTAGGLEFIQWAADLDVVGANSTADQIITGIKNSSDLTARKNAAVIGGPTTVGAASVDTSTFTLGSIPGLGSFFSGRIYGLMLAAGTPDPTAAEKWLGARSGVSL